MTTVERVDKIAEECDGCWSLYGVTSWERTFLESIKERSTLSERQETTLADIERKVFGG